MRYKVRIQGAEVRKLNTPLEDIELSIPILAEMINDLREEVRNTWYKRLWRFLKRDISSLWGGK